MKMLKVKDCMHSPVVKIDVSKSIMDAAKLMFEKQIGSLIISNGKSLDIITERDILKAVAEDKLNLTLDKTIEDPLITISPDASLGEAAQQMIVKGIRRLVVVDTQGVVGILSIRDVVQGVHEAFLALFDL